MNGFRFLDPGQMPFTLASFAQARASRRASGLAVGSGHASLIVYYSGIGSVRPQKTARQFQQITTSGSLFFTDCFGFLVDTRAKVYDANGRRSSRRSLQSATALLTDSHVSVPKSGVCFHEIAPCWTTCFAVPLVQWTTAAPAVKADAEEANLLQLVRSAPLKSLSG